MRRMFCCFTFALILLVVFPFASPFTNAVTSSSVALSRTRSSSSPRVLKAFHNNNNNNNNGGGEYNATLSSRLLFKYASPLLDLAQERELEEEDVDRFPTAQQMQTSVPRLAQIYNNRRKKAAATARKRRDHTTQDARILLEALLIHQRRNILITGILRLTNTAVQAFPAILVSRLLRFLETGAHPSKAIGAALSLVAVLSIKMVTENQYFHNIVKTATQTRGVLAGLIFDKSLRLPSTSTGGGSGSQVENNNKNKNKQQQSSLGVGGVLNLMQSDASTLESTSLQIHTIWDGPLQVSVSCIVFLFHSLDLSLYIIIVLLHFHSIYLYCTVYLSNHTQHYNIDHHVHIPPIPLPRK